MLRVPERVGRKFGVWLVREGVPSGAHGRYRKWLRYYLDFCHKYGYGYLGEGSLDGFRGKLESKHQSAAQVREVEAAVRVYFRMAGSGAVIGVDDRGALAIREDGGRQGSAEGWGRVEPTVGGAALKGRFQPDRIRIFSRQGAKTAKESPFLFSSSAASAPLRESVFFVFERSDLPVVGSI